MLARLQKDVMSVRKVPVAGLFQRFPRVIRQLAASLNKEIDFKITGDDTVIDKDLLETIENPLVHILRNSLDHEDIVLIIDVGKIAMDVENLNCRGCYV